MRIAMTLTLGLALLITSGCGGGGGGGGDSGDWRSRLPVVTASVNGTQATLQDYGPNGVERMMQYLDVHDGDVILLHSDRKVIFFIERSGMVLENETRTDTDWQATFRWNGITPGELGSCTVDMTTSPIVGGAPTLEVQFILHQ